MRTMWACAAVAIGVALALAACGSPSATYQVTGVALARPGCPVDRPGETCPPIPVVAPVVFTSDGREVARATSDPTGRFAMSLPAGAYVVTVETPGGAPPTCPTTELTVSTGPVDLAVDCDSGIR